MSISGGHSRSMAGRPAVPAGRRVGAVRDCYLAGPPVGLQRALFTALGPVARLRGYRARYDRFKAG
jgi:hypothetical protein